MKVLLVDGNPLMWRAAFGWGEQHVAAGILTFISDAVKQFQPNGLVVCWDVDKSRWRSNLFPDYKAKRHEQREKLDYDLVLSQAELARTFLKAIGLPSLGVPETEADDLLAWLSEYFINTVKIDDVIIVTGDKDLWQLVRTIDDRRITVYDMLRDRWVDEDRVKELMGVTPEMIPQLKALQGDPSDGIPGIHKIGEKTAIKLFEQYGEVFNFLENSKELIKKKTTAKIVSQYEDVEIFYNLTKLPTLQEAKYLLQDQLSGFIGQLNFTQQIDIDTKHFIMGQLGRIVEINELSVPPIQPVLASLGQFLQKPVEVDLTWENLGTEILNCSRCPLRANCEPILPEGFTDAPIMIIGRNPSSSNIDLVTSMLEEIGFTREQCWITNVNKCNTEKGRPTSYGEQEACMSYLKAEIGLLKPKLIIALGNEAMSAVSPYQSGVMKHCGEILDNPVGRVGDLGCKVILGISTSKALRDSEGKEHWSFFISKLKGLFQL